MGNPAVPDSLGIDRDAWLKQMQPPRARPTTQGPRRVLGATLVPGPACWVRLFSGTVGSLPRHHRPPLPPAGREAIVGAEGVIQKGLLALALLAVIAFLPRLIGRLRRRSMLRFQDLKQRLGRHEGVLVLDVRTAADHVGEQGHIADSTNIPVEDLVTRLEELSDRIERPTAIVCRTDRRSAKAAQILARNGYADVHIVQGGV